MGCEFEVLLCGEDEDHLIAVANEALEEIERLEEQMSLYLPSSELCWLNAQAAHQPVQVEAGLFALLQTAAQISADTEGAFDITAAPLVKCWGFFQGEGMLPLPEKIAAARKLVGMKHVQLNGAEQTVRFGKEGMELDLGGIGKGYAVQRATEIMQKYGVCSALLHGGQSTVYALGTPPGEECWTVGIQHPLDSQRRVAVVHLRDRALSTSGFYERFFTVEGKVYTHLLDPRTGYPVREMLSASALAPTATESDALSTAFFILGVEGTKEYCRNHEQVGAILVLPSEKGEEVEVFHLGLVE